MEYPKTTGNELWVWGRDATPSQTLNLYNVTPGGTISVSAVTVTVPTGLARPPAFTRIATGAGVYLITAAGRPGGSAGVYVYDGTAWYSQPTFGGLDSRNILRLATYKQRVFFTEIDTPNLWFLPPNSISGSATRYPLGAVFSRGGSIVDILNWSVDAGNGPDDQLVVFSSNGEAAVFTGTDPSSPFTWSLVGVYYVGLPAGHAPLVKAGPDVWIHTTSGVYSLTVTMRTGEFAKTAELTAPVHREVITPVTAGTGVVPRRRLLGYSPDEAVAFLVTGPNVVAPSFLPAAGAGINTFLISLCYAVDNSAWSEHYSMEYSSLGTWRGTMYAGTASGEVVQLNFANAPATAGLNEVPWANFVMNLEQQVRLTTQGLAQVRRIRPLFSASIVGPGHTAEVSFIPSPRISIGATISATVPIVQKATLSELDAYWGDVECYPTAYGRLLVQVFGPQWGPLQYQGADLEFDVLRAG